MDTIGKMALGGIAALVVWILVVPAFRGGQSPIEIESPVIRVGREGESAAADGQGRLPLVLGAHEVAGGQRPECEGRETANGGCIVNRSATLHTGTCVHFDPTASTINGTNDPDELSAVADVRYWNDADQFAEVTMLRSASFRGRQATYYWTPCNN